eukprot:scaffold57980_cov16-Tisochrysis_lutea.AAC.4
MLDSPAFTITSSSLLPPATPGNQPNTPPPACSLRSSQRPTWEELWQAWLLPEPPTTSSCRWCSERVAGDVGAVRPLALLGMMMGFSFGMRCERDSGVAVVVVRAQLVLVPDGDASVPVSGGEECRAASLETRCASSEHVEAVMA